MVGAHGHDHARTDNRPRLIAALFIVAVVLVAEVVGALLTGSLALLADAGHMLSDLFGLIVAVIAASIALRPPSSRHTYGLQRAEVLGALFNGLVLAIVALAVFVEAIARLLTSESEHVLPIPMLVIAAVGLVANIAALVILRGGDRSSLNMRGATLEVFGDLLGSIAVVVAGVIILLTGFSQADAIASLAIALMIAPRAALLIRDVLRVLTQSVPRDTDLAAIRDHIGQTPGVHGVHDIHVWEITSGAKVFSAHVVVQSSVFRDGKSGVMLDQLNECLAAHFDVAHSTFQLETAEHAAHEEHPHP